MRRLVYRLSLIALLLPAAAMAQSKQTPLKMTAKECVAYALRNQDSMKNARLEQKKLLSKNREVTGLALPQVAAKGGINYAPLIAAFEVDNFIKTMLVGAPGVPNSGLIANDAVNSEVANRMPDKMLFAFQPKWTTTAQAELNQVLFDPSIMVALQARKTLEDLAQQNVDLTEQDVKVNVLKAYYGILVAEKTKGTIDQNFKRIQELENQTRETYKNGLAEKIEVDRLTVMLNNIRTQQVRIDQAIRIAYWNLKFRMGMQLEQPIILEDSLSETSLSTELLSRPLVYENRPEYRLLNSQKDLSEYDLKRYKLAGLPSLNLFGNYGYTLYNMNNLFDAGDKWQTASMIGTQLYVPIFQGFRRKEQVKQARFKVEQVENNIHNLKLALDLETENAKSELRANLLTLANQRENMALAESVYNTAKLKYREGVGSSLEVVDAESALKDAQGNYYSALFDAVNSRINLEKALGELQ